MFYNARWYDPGLGRFAQADTIIPLQTQGVQAWDRYAGMNNNPVRYNDPSGHCISGGIDTLACILIALLLSGCTSSGPTNADIQSAETAILDTSVGIEMLDAGGNVLGYSLATNLGDGQLYTHDHFDFNSAPEDAAMLNLYSASGDLIDSYAGADISRAVLTERESSIIQLPASLAIGEASLTGVTQGDIQAGQMVGAPSWVGGSPNAGLAVVWGKVTEAPDKIRTGFVWNGITHGGDSGGGTWLWLNGKFVLIGNIRGGIENRNTRSTYDRPIAD